MIENCDAEVSRFHQTLQRSRNELTDIREKARRDIGRVKLPFLMPIY